MALCLSLVGCGGTDRDPRPAPRATAAAAGRLLTVQRNGGHTATLDLLTIRRDGTATVDKRYGGAGRRISRFRVTTRWMHIIRRALDRLPAHPARRSTGNSENVTFLLTAGGRTYTVQRGSMTHRERLLFDALDRVISGAGRE